MGNKTSSHVPDPPSAKVLIHNCIEFILFLEIIQDIVVRFSDSVSPKYPVESSKSIVHPKTPNTIWKNGIFLYSHNKALILYT